MPKNPDKNATNAINANKSLLTEVLNSSNRLESSFSSLNEAARSKFSLASGTIGAMAGLLITMAGVFASAQYSNRGELDKEISRAVRADAERDVIRGQLLDVTASLKTVTTERDALAKSKPLRAQYGNFKNLDFWDFEIDSDSYRVSGKCASGCLISHMEVIKIVRDEFLQLTLVEHIDNARLQNISVAHRRLLPLIEGCSLAVTIAKFHPRVYAVETVERPSLRVGVATIPDPESGWLLAKDSVSGKCQARKIAASESEIRKLTSNVHVFDQK